MIGECGRCKEKVFIPTDKYCHGCGIEISYNSMRILMEIRQCKKCNNWMLLTDKHCRSCGTPHSH